MKVVFFDFNGTLLDDMPIWRQATEANFRSFGVEPPSTAEYFRRLEEFKGDYRGVYQSFGINVTRHRLNTVYESVYTKLLDQATFFTGVRFTLDALRSSGKKSVLITTQKEFLVTPLLQRIGVEKYFHSSRFGIFDKSGVMNEILSGLGVEPSECCYVGDAPSDMRHAEKAGVLPVAFLGGYIPEELLLKNGVRPIRSLGEILSIV